MFGLCLSPLYQSLTAAVAPNQLLIGAEPQRPRHSEREPSFHPGAFSLTNTRCTPFGRASGAFQIINGVGRAQKD